MGETESTREVAERTGPDGAATRAETRRETTTQAGQDGEPSPSGGEPKQVLPEGR